MAKLGIMYKLVRYSFGLSKMYICVRWHACERTLLQTEQNIKDIFHRVNTDND